MYMYASYENHCATYGNHYARTGIAMQELDSLCEIGTRITASDLESVIEKIRKSPYENID